VIAAKLEGRCALQVKNRWNWLRRHHCGAEGLAALPRRPVYLPDVVEQRLPQRIFDAINPDDSVFGIAFQEFQAKMLLHYM
jgi:hypothetical protein